MSVPAWLHPYIGIPYADGGHGFDGVSCWGLCHLVLKEQAGITTPTYAEYSAGDLLAAAKEFRANAASDLWPQVAAPQLFDLALMHAMTDDERHRLHGHVGIMISPTRVLHVWKATASCHMAISHPRIRFNIISFHRHRDLS